MNLNFFDGIQRLMWLERNPDFNIIEHVCDLVKGCIRRQNPAPENVVLEDWHNIPQEFITNLFCDISSRLRGG